MSRANHVAWVWAAILALTVAGGVGVLGVRLRPYWIAKYRGGQVNLVGALLVYAPLEGIGWHGVDLADANLAGANLQGACLNYVTLDRACLRGASLRGATVWRCSLREADLRGTDMSGARLEASILTGARYDAGTRWPSGFDPVKAGAILAR